MGLLFSTARCSSARAYCAAADWRFTAAVAAASALVFADAAATKNNAALIAAKTGEWRAKLIRKIFFAPNINPHPPNVVGCKRPRTSEKNKLQKKIKCPKPKCRAPGESK